MAKKPFDQHPEFQRVANMVNEALADIANRLDCIDDLHALRPHTDRIADDMVKLFLRAYDRNHISGAA